MEGNLLRVIESEKCKILRDKKYWGDRYEEVMKEKERRLEELGEPPTWN